MAELDAVKASAQRNHDLAISQAQSELTALQGNTAAQLARQEQTITILRNAQAEEQKRHSAEATKMAMDLVSEKQILRASQGEVVRVSGELRNSNIELTRAKHQHAMVAGGMAPQGGTPSVDEHLCGKGTCIGCQHKAQ